MAVTFKVVETFHLVEGADLTDLQRAIDIVADIPFDLSQQVIDRGVRFVNLVRDGDAQSEDPEPEPKPGTADKGCQTEDSQWPGRKGNWQGKHWQETDWKETDWQETDRQDQGGQESDWQWQGGNPCHVCGKVRAEHPGKKFCDLQANKRARV